MTTKEDQPAESKELEGSSSSSLPPVSPDAVEQDESGHFDDIVPTVGYSMVPVVGLGGSAGGIQALKAFFSTVPENSGFAFVIVLHLAPEHESILPEILSLSTAMPVMSAEDGKKIEANTVYVIPPGKFLTLNGERLRLVPFVPERGKRMAVDVFFRTLGDTHGAHAVAIVLSGADGDGAIGLRRVKERGGLTIAQEPSEAEHSGMPQTAIDTGMVDWVLPVQEIPSRVVEYFANESRLQILPAETALPSSADYEFAEGDVSLLREILAYLKVRTSRDFACYKRATIIRRISRRMQVNSVTSLSQYLGFLRTNPGEAGALQQDLLISVTNFFRDREVFDALEQRIHSLFKGKGAGDVVRVWVAACATGEEAYSVGMLLLEHAGQLPSPPSIQIFATDLAEEAIIKARDAFYPSAITADVSEERLRRFFTQESKGYRLRRELRECVLFAVHDVLRDAPFSRIDLITCRNLLIYLTPEAQKQVLNTFHFALVKRGMLLLGTSESIDENGSWWTTLDKKHRMFAQIPQSKPGMSVPIGPDTLVRALQAHENRGTGRFLPGAAFLMHTAMSTDHAASPDTSQISWERLHFKLIERFSPPSILITRDYDIVHISPSAGRLLHFSGGELTTNLLGVVHPELRVELRAVLFRAAQANSSAEVFEVPMELEGKTVAVNIRVCPAQDIAPDYLLVVFEINEASEGQAVTTRSEEPAARHLEAENEQLRRRLRDVIEQNEASNEEQKAGNEELQAMNEELRSSAEELETSKEELQSINEELTTVNLELKSKVDELSKTNSDFTNLMAATGVATIFLDRSFKVARYTRAANAIFNLIPADIGRPLEHITHKLDYPDFSKDAARVFSTLIPIQREVTDGTRWYLARILPYRTSEDQILGLVLSFVEVTEFKKAKDALTLSETRLRLVLESAREYAIFALDLDRKVASWNAGAERLLGYTESEIVGSPGDVIFTSEDRDAHAPEKEAETALRHGRASDERWHVRKDGTRFWGSGSMMSMNGSNGQPIGLVKVFCDRTEQRAAQLALQQSQEELKRALKENEEARSLAEAATRAKDRFLAMLSHELRTPLTPVCLGLSMLEDQDIPDDAKDILEIIKKNIELESQLIDDLLDVSRITHEKLELNLLPCDLHSVIQNAIGIVQSEVAARKQALEVNLASPVTRLLGDPSRLVQVFWNLFKNASKFTPEGGSISVKTWNDGDKIYAQISDTGIGFQPEAASDLFEAFNQSSGSSGAKLGGLGLGLAIAKAITTAHNGGISAASNGADRGAVFTVWLPLAPP